MARRHVQLNLRCCGVEEKFRRQSFSLAVTIEMSLRSLERFGAVLASGRTWVRWRKSSIRTDERTEGATPSRALLSKDGDDPDRGARMLLLVSVAVIAASLVAILVWRD